MDLFFGLYWTLPVPWAGFTSLPKDPRAAAAQSRTIAYQRERVRVRRWVVEEGGDLVAEEVFLELAPDRGSQEILPAVDLLLERARDEQARLVLVDFSEAYGWRKHAPLREHLARHPDLHVMLDPMPLLLAGADAFDPVRHFRAWREVEERHAAAKPARKAMLAQAIAERQGRAGEQPSLASLAQALNADGLTTPTGKPWSAENLRKFMAGI
jgi:hypothetical protein